MSEWVLFPQQNQMQTNMSTKNKSNDNFINNSYNVLFREIFVPLFLMITTPNLTVVLSYIIVNKKSNLSKTLLSFNQFKYTLINAWTSVEWYESIIHSVFSWILLFHNFCYLSSVPQISFSEVCPYLLVQPILTLTFTYLFMSSVFVLSFIQMNKSFCGSI